jgi:hypothetical protein
VEEERAGARHREEGHGWVGDTTDIRLRGGSAEVRDAPTTGRRAGRVSCWSPRTDPNGGERDGQDARTGDPSR